MTVLHSTDYYRSVVEVGELRRTGIVDVLGNKELGMTKSYMPAPVRGAETSTER